MKDLREMDVEVSVSNTSQWQLAASCVASPSHLMVSTRTSIPPHPTPLFTVQSMHGPEDLLGSKEKVPNKEGKALLDKNWHLVGTDSTQTQTPQEKHQIVVSAIWKVKMMRCDQKLLWPSGSETTFLKRWHSGKGAGWVEVAASTFRQRVQLGILGNEIKPGVCDCNRWGQLCRDDWGWAGGRKVKESLVHRTAIDRSLGFSRKPLEGFRMEADRVWFKLSFKKDYSSICLSGQK